MTTFVGVGGNESRARFLSLFLRFLDFPAPRAGCAPRGEWCFCVESHRPHSCAGRVKILSGR